ncbi:hypothetical protein XA67_00185 [Comamonas thiooxydans]|nr:hypothetical protein XA67_00185 [Comamonas thiooxydans]
MGRVGTTYVKACFLLSAVNWAAQTVPCRMQQLVTDKCSWQCHANDVVISFFICPSAHQLYLKNSLGLEVQLL